ncbi:MAG: response regulator transcription factor [Lacibacter sp.]|jgi:DNA-binding NarL/FixJ family response regulator
MKYTHGKSLIRIAIAEDHILVRQALSQIINSWDNCKVIIQASNGSELIELLNNEETPELILVDISMPVLNGFDTITRIRMSDQSVKICALSFYDSQELINRLIKIGVNGFVNKNDDIVVLKTAINEIMKSGYYYSDISTLKILMKLRDSKSVPTKISFTDEEYRFLKLIASDKTYKEIAKEMNTNERHIDYLTNYFFEYYEVKSRTGLAMKVIQNGMNI